VKPLKPTLIAANLLLIAASAYAQTAPPRVTILLDPAHGGSDPGAHLAPDALEKDINLAFAQRLRTGLVAQGFNVVLTREPDQPDAPTPDQRAETANHAHPIACLILHSTAAGHGVHLFTSSLIPLTIVDEIKPIQPWETAQAAAIPQSLRLVNELASAFNSAHLPLLISRASIRPIDSLTCPAVALEIAPLPGSGTSDTPTPATDAAYQQTVADAVANALVSWRLHTQPADAK
jgi:N-acetylmuramoyl-L-alanine amidase